MGNCTLRLYEGLFRCDLSSIIWIKSTGKIKTMLEITKVLIVEQFWEHMINLNWSLLLEEEETAKQVNVQFARNLPDYKKKEREQSFQQHSKKTAEEKWIETVYFPSTSAQAEV